MNLVIDPDVFAASFHEFSCQAALVKISGEIKSHQFYQDKERVLDREYRLIFNERYKDEAEHLAIRLLQHILFEDGNSENEVSASCGIREQLEQLGCSSPVEPDLLGLLANARDKGLVLMLVGHNTSHTRPRVLHDTETFRTIGKIIPWLDVRWAGEATVEIPSLQYKDTNATHLKSSEFEGKVALWLQDKDCTLKCITPPPKGEVGTEQIDVYGYRCSSDKTVVVVGECKLRREGNEAAKPIERREVQQLIRKLVATRKYEESRRRKSTDGKVPTRFEGILVSNATTLDEEAKNRIDGCDFPLRFLRVILPNKWETQQEWRILEGDWIYSHEPL